MAKKMASSEPSGPRVTARDILLRLGAVVAAPPAPPAAAPLARAATSECERDGCRCHILGLREREEEEVKSRPGDCDIGEGGIGGEWVGLLSILGTGCWRIPSIT